MMQYEAKDLKIISAVEAIRSRPATYLGPLDDSSLFNRIIQESLCLAADEALSGHCGQVRVQVRRDGSVTVRDKGRGLPMAPDASGRLQAELLLTELFACRARKQGRIAESCCEMGLVAVNAVSEWLRFRNFRDGACWSQDYEKGRALGPFRREAATAESGIELSYRLDTAILGPLRFDDRALVGWFTGLGLGFASVNVEGDGLSGGPQTLLFEGISPQA